jgi:hypothetical protein
MKTKFDIEARNAEARATLKTIENELFYGRLRREALAKSLSAARKRGDAEAEDRLYQGWKEEDRAIREMTERKAELIVLAAEKKYANQHLYSDIQPWEVIDEKSPTRIVVRAMRSQIRPEAARALQESFVAGGFFGHFDNDAQKWDITPDKDGVVVELRKHKDGHWYEAGDRHCPFVLATEPVKRYDYNF